MTSVDLQQMYRVSASGSGLLVGSSRVLIVSMGALEKGPMAPDIRPISMC